MMVSIKSETRANGVFIIEKWASGRTVDHGPIPAEKVEEYAAELQATIIRQTQQQKELLGALVRTEEQRAFLAQKEKTWLQKRKR